MNTTNEYKQLKTKYPYIVAWGQMMNSFGDYIEGQLIQAEADNAPTDAIYKRADGSWSVATDEIKKRLEYLMQ